MTATFLHHLRPTESEFPRQFNGNLKLKSILEVLMISNVFKFNCRAMNQLRVELFSPTNLAIK